MPLRRGAVKTWRLGAGSRSLCGLRHELEHAVEHLQATHDNVSTTSAPAEINYRPRPSWSLTRQISPDVASRFATKVAPISRQISPNEVHSGDVLHSDAAFHRAQHHQAIAAGIANLAEWGRASSRRSASSGVAVEPSRGSLSRWGMAMFDSGMASGVLFLLAMLVYDAGILFRQYKSVVICSWINFFGAAIFTSESLIDIAWSLHARRAARAQETATALFILDESMAESSADASHSVSLLDNPRARVKTEVLDTVDWDLWAGVFFFIPSVLEIFEALVDPNISGTHSWNFLRWAGVDTTMFSATCDLMAVLLYLFDAALGLLGRWRYIKQTPLDERMLIFKVWKAPNYADVDWAFWGDCAFLAGACCDVYAHFATGDIIFGDLDDYLWTADGLLYVIAALPSMLHLTRPESPSAQEPIGTPSR